MYETVGSAAGVVGGGARSLGANVPSAREVQVNGAMVSLSHNMEMLHSVLEQLSQRMCSVLAPCAPSNEKNPTGIRPARAPLAESIDRLDEQAQRMNAMVGDLLSRLEV